MQYSITQHKGRWWIFGKGEILFSGSGGTEIAISVLLLHGIAMSNVLIQSTNQKRN